MKKIFTIVGILLLASCSKDEMFLEIEEQIQKQQLDTTSVAVTPPPAPPAEVAQAPKTFTLYKESYLNQRSGNFFSWSNEFDPYNPIMDNRERTTQGDYDNGHAYGDVNKDGFMDILAKYQPNDGTYKLAWFINSGDNFHFTSTTEYFNQSSEGLRAYKILKTDVNNDNIADYVVLGIIERPYGGNFTVLIGTPDGKFDIKNIPNPSDYWFYNGAAGDLNGDGFVDVITATFIWYGDGKGNFTKTIEMNNLPFVKDILTYEILDMDKDGWNDLILRGPHDTRIAIVFNNKGTFDRNNKVVYLPKPQYTDAQDIEITDLDGDGDLDIVQLAFLGGHPEGSQDPYYMQTKLTAYYNDNFTFTKDETLFIESKDGNFINGDKDFFGWTLFKFDDIDGDGVDEIVAENAHNGNYNALKKINGVWKKVMITFGK